MYYHNDDSVGHLDFYFPKFDGTHEKPYVAWDIAITPKANTYDKNITTFKIKFFNCDL